MLAFSAPSAAQSYPNKPIRYVVGFTSGTATDLVARMVAQRLSERWGQQVIVDNRVGAAGTIGATTVARSTPDGYTLYMASSTMVVSPFFMSGVSYDVFRDFAPVVLMVSLPMVLIVPAQLPVQTVQDLIAMAKAKPGQLNYAHTGRGTSSHISSELLSALTGVELTEVSFKSTVDAMSAVVRGDVALYYPNLAGALPFIKQGRVKALAVSTAKRSNAAPETPTMAESVPGFDAMSFYGIVVPSRTPGAVVAKLNAEVNAVLAEPDMRRRLLDVGGDVVGGAPEVLTARMKAERDQVSQVVKRIHAREGKKP
jgi:tripartite-type tricarboxylate transporter receptor subunit TctC